jgi:LMBR1 domain-containing protein 1
MLNWWLIVVAAVMSLIIIGVIFYIVILYSSVEDKNQAWLPKVIVVLGLSLACFTVLLLPYDVANRKDPSTMDSFGGGLDTALMWQIVLWSIASFTIVIVPFATFYYEAWDPDNDNPMQQIYPAMSYTLMSLVTFTVLLCVLWYTVGFADIPYQRYTATPQYLQNINDDKSIILNNSKSSDTLSIQVSVFVYMVGLMSALGWIAFVFFAGVGLTSLPIDLIMDWVQRPQPITLDMYARAKEDIASRSNFLIDIGKKLEEKQRGGNTSRSIRKKVNLFKAEVLELENKFERLEVSYKDRGGSPFLAWGKMLLGTLGIFLSIFWMLHIIIYNMAGVDPFLNTFFIALDQTFSLFGTVAYGIFSFYLLWAVMKGLFRLGVRLLFFTVHPMKIGDTLMNSFLFNTMIILVCSVTVTQFCAMSFREYAANTAVDSMFSTYVLRLRGIGYIMIYMQYLLVFNMCVSLGCVLCCPKKEAEPSEFD